MAKGFPLPHKTRQGSNPSQSGDKVTQPAPGVTTQQESLLHTMQVIVNSVTSFSLLHDNDHFFICIFVHGG